MQENRKIFVLGSGRSTLMRLSQLKTQIGKFNMLTRVMGVGQNIVDVLDVYDG